MGIGERNKSHYLGWELGLKVSTQTRTCFPDHGVALSALDHVPRAVQRVRPVVLNRNVLFAEVQIIKFETPFACDGTATR